MARRNSGGVGKAVAGMLIVAASLGGVAYYHHLNTRIAPAIAGATAPSPHAAVVAVTPTGVEPVRMVTPGSATGTTPVATPVATVDAGRAVASTQATPETFVAPAGPATAPAGAVIVPAELTATSPKPLLDGKAKLDAGQFLEARNTLNDALNGGSLTAAEELTARRLIATVNETLVFSPRHDPADPLVDTVTVKPGDRLARIAADHAITPELLLRMNGMTDPRRLRSGQTLKVLRGPLHAVVSKSRFTLDLYAKLPTGNLYVTGFRVGLGRDDSTPTGTWLVQPQNKLQNPTYYSPRGEGIIAAGDPTNPLGKFWIGLTGIDGQAVGKLSYGIHGTIHPESIGQQESMGCIRLLNEDVARVFELLVEGKSTVVVQQ